MKLVFSGAAHEVTGSCHYLNVCGKNILLDCGMEQGRDRPNGETGRQSVRWKVHMSLSILQRMRRARSDCLFPAIMMTLFLFAKGWTYSSRI